MLTTVEGTNRVDVYRCSDPEFGTFWLIDTPGFNDTYRSDAEVLGDIVNWLNQAYIGKIQLTGILYIHPIRETKMGAKAIDSLSSFKKLCGAEALRKVVLVTTFWDEVEPIVGEDRERELRESTLFWAIMLSRGSKVFRHYNRRSTAKAVIRHLLNIRTEQDQGTFLDIQREMVDQMKNLDQTSAGQLMMTALERQRKAFERELADLQEELDSAIAQQNEEHRKAVEELRRQADESRRRAAEDRRNMQANYRSLMHLVAERDAIEDAEDEREQKRREEEERELLNALSDLAAQEGRMDDEKELREKLAAKRRQHEQLEWRRRQQGQLQCVIL